MKLEYFRSQKYIFLRIQEYITKTKIQEHRDSLRNLYLSRIWNSLYFIKHTQLNITKTRIYHNNILKIGIIKYTFYLMKLVYKNY